MALLVAAPSVEDEDIEPAFRASGRLQASVSVILGGKLCRVMLAKRASTLT